MLESISECLLCHNTDLQNNSQVVDHFGSKELFSIVECQRCQTLYTSPRPDAKSIITYYKSNSYVSHGDAINLLFDSVYKFIQSINFKFKKRILDKYTLSRKHLDFGCGNASFLNYLNRQKWNVTGIEPDEAARNNADENLTIHSNLDQLPKGEQYSSISLFHVLEHVHQLKKTLTSLIDKLDKNGVIILALPNFKSLDASAYGEFWAGYDAPRHLYHFSQKSLHQLAKTFGLNIVATHPMKFDSYYVSLLSEENKTGNKKYLSAMINGYKSNQSAKKTGEYSSLIYILSK